MMRMMSSMNCSRNDIVLLPIPFTDLTSRKVRPAVVIGKNGSDLFLVPISSVLANTDFPLTNWQQAGLNVPSGIKAQIATVQENLVVKIVCQIVVTDSKTLNIHLRRWLTL